MNPTSSALWRRLDVPGHDCCRLERTGAGWHLQGMAVFRHERGPAAVAYEVRCDEGWRTLGGHVRGHVGARGFDHAIARSGSTWTLDGAPVAGLEHLVDLDFGFTPATNMLPTRRLPFAEGETVQSPAAWFDIDGGGLVALSQSYQRRGGDAIWYESPTVGYRALIELLPNGFVRRYPGLWEAE